MSDVESRFWKRKAVCRRLGISVASSYKKLPILEKAGFPKMHPVLKGWDSVAIARYLDAAASLVNSAPVKDYRGAGHGL